MPYAINIADTLCPDRLALTQLVFGPYLPATDRARLVCAVPGRFDEYAIVLECDDETAAAILGVIRARCHQNEWRCYYSPTGNGGWRRV